MEPKADAVVTSAVHRLLFEAGTFVVAELRQALESSVGRAQSSSVDAREEQSPSGASGQARLLSHLRSVTSLAFQLVHLCSAMIADQAIRHIPLNRCSSREQEVSNVKRDENLFRLENAAFRLAVKPQPLKVDLSTELRVSQALSRRGLALEKAGVASLPGRRPCPLPSRG